MSKPSEQVSAERDARTKEIAEDAKHLAADVRRKISRQAVERAIACLLP